jgi:hypothetical protein
MEGHGLATLFLAGAYEDEPDEARRKKLNHVLTRAVKYIVKAQSSQGGWYHTSKAEGHDFAAILPTVMQIQALQAAENAGIAVPNGTIDAGQAYLEMALKKYEKDAKAKNDANRAADTAAALASRPSLGGVDRLSLEWSKYCQTKIPVGRSIEFGRDELAHYFYSQAVFLTQHRSVDGETWEAYSAVMFERLKSDQNEDGSWPAGDGIGVGPVYSTAVWCTILQLDRRSHPLMRIRLAID